MHACRCIRWARAGGIRGRWSQGSGCMCGSCEGLPGVGGWVGGQQRCCFALLLLRIPHATAATGAAAPAALLLCPVVVGCAAQITAEGEYAPLCTFLETLLTMVW
jgi:hypothetical protein